MIIFNFNLTVKYLIQISPIFTETTKYTWNKTQNKRNYVTNILKNDLKVFF